MAVNIEARILSIRDSLKGVRKYCMYVQWKYAESVVGGTENLGGVGGWRRKKVLKGGGEGSIYSGPKQAAAWETSCRVK